MKLFNVILIFLFASIIFQLNGQTDMSISIRLNRIDSIVNSSNTYSALQEIGPLYKEFIQSDSTSENFKKLAREYVFILIKSEVNDKAISLSNILLNRNFEDPKFNAEILVLLARLHEKVGNRAICKSRLDEARSLLSEVLDDSLTMIWNIRYASYQRIYEDKDSAVLFAQEAFNIAKRINQPEHQATASFLLAFLSNDIDYQIERLNYSKNIYQKNTDISGTASMCMGLRRLYLKKGDTVTSQFYLDTIGTFLKGTPYLTTRLWYYEAAKENFRSKNLLDSAIVYYDSVSALTRQLQEKRDRIQLLTNDLIFDNQRLLEDLSKKEILILKEKKEKQLITVFLTTALLLVIVIMLLSFDQYKKRRIIAHQKDLVKRRNIELNNAIEKNDTLLLELNHRVKNNLATLSGLLYMQASKTTSKLVKNQLSASINRINTLSEIYRRALDNESLKFSNFTEIIESVCIAQFDLSGRERNLLKLNLDELALETKQITPLVLSLNELITNAIKYSKADSVVKVDLLKEGNEIVCTVTNFGEGLAKNYTIENSSSAGLFIVQILAKQLKGEFNWKTVDNLFTIGFRFPNSSKQNSTNSVLTSSY